jgi:hypothetical protein
LSETVSGLDSETPTGVFFDEQTPDAIAHAIRLFERNAERISPDACIRSAQRFSAERFRAEFSAYVAERWRAFQHGTSVR